MYDFPWTAGGILLMATRNPVRKPVEVGRFSHYLEVFLHLRWLGMGFLPSTVWRGSMGGYPIPCGDSFLFVEVS